MKSLSASDTLPNVSRLSIEDTRRVRAIRDELATVRLGGPPVMDAVLPALREALRTDKIITYALRPHGDGLAVRWAALERLPRDHLVQSFDRFLEGRGIDWTSYNPVRPEPSQRNRAMLSSAIATTVGHDPFQQPIAKFFAQVGLGGHDNLRALVCDGPSLLAWVGAFQQEPFDASQARVLSAVLPAMQRRLRLEHQIADFPRTTAALAAALEAIGGAAFVIGPHGELHEANSAALTLLGQRNRDVRLALRDAAAKRPAALAFRLTPLVGPGEPGGYLAILREPPASIGSNLDRAAARWGLTPRQRQTLELVAEGRTNAAIAATLGIAERTVELHVSLLFDKAGVENRSALVGSLLCL